MNIELHDCIKEQQALGIGLDGIIICISNGCNDRVMGIYFHALIRRYACHIKTFIGGS